MYRLQYLRKRSTESFQLTTRFLHSICTSLVINMIIYSKKGNKLIVKVNFEIENTPDNEDLNKVIAHGLMNLAKQVIEKKVKIYDSDKIGVY